MAKTGQDEKPYDPFGTLSALDDALGDLDEKAEVTPKAAPKQAGKSRPVVKASPKRNAPASPGGGGGKPASQRIRKSSAPKKEAGLAPKKPKRFLATPEDAARFDKAAMTLGAHLGVSVDFSKVTRALWEIYIRHEEDILRNVPAGTVWERPSNSDTVGLAELDERLADLLNEGLMVASRRPSNARQSRD